MLATKDVYVYLTNTGGQSSAINYASRSDNSSHLLTLDGITAQNTNTATPNWVTTITPSRANFQAAPKFTITTGTPFTSGDSNGSACRGYLTLRGLKFSGTGQILTAMHLHDFVMEYSEFTDTSGSIGPGILVGPRAGPGGCASDHVTIRWNYGHHTYGETIYVGASQSDPSCSSASAPGAGGCQPNGTNIATGDDYLIYENVLEDCGWWGGDENCIDVKDGHTNLRIIGNVLRPRKDGPGSGAIEQALVMESGQLVERNYIEGAGHNGIVLGESWNNVHGRTATLEIRNNIVINSGTGGSGDRAGIRRWPPNNPSMTSGLFTDVRVYNNTVYSAGDSCIKDESGNVSASIMFVNNLVANCSGGIGSVAAQTTVHDYNLYYNIGATPITGATCSGSHPTTETHSLCGTDPLFVNISTPYLDTNFKVQVGSPAINSGTPLGSFSTDYFGLARPVGAAWDIGAAER